MKAIDFYYILTGFENATPFITKFTFTELANNEGVHADTEMFYALQKQPEKVCTLELYKPLEVSINRDSVDDIAMIIRVPKDRYLKTKITD